MFFNPWMGKFWYSVAKTTPQRNAQILQSAKGLGQYLRFLFITGIGRANVVAKMKDAIYVFEFKFDGTPEEVLAQIDSKQYTIPYRSDDRRIVKVGGNFDSAARTIGAWKIE